MIRDINYKEYKQILNNKIRSLLEMNYANIS